MMKYPPEWKGRLRLASDRTDIWDGAVRGDVLAKTKRGAKSPGGLVTNVVWTARPAAAADAREFAAKTEAIRFLISRAG